VNLLLKLCLTLMRCLGRLGRGCVHARSARYSAHYRASHRRLLTDVSASASGSGSLRLGCVFVPVSRSFAEHLPGLRLATELASAQRCYLVISCSKKARIEDFPRDLAARTGGRLILINHAGVHPDWHPSLDSLRRRASRFHRANDAGDKRNLALSLAASLGWQSVLFLDDDIFSLADVSTLDPASLGRALSTLYRRSELQIVGWSATHFPDNSVIGHARRLVGLKQEVFIGAGAMLVRCDERISYFPNIYNQDWLFVIAQALLSKRPFRAIGWAGNVGQTAYHPFRTGRARSEETGDVIGEGALNLFEDHGSNFEERATAAYWLKSLTARRELISQLRLRIGNRPLSTSSWSGESISGALAAAAKVNVQFDAVELAEYVRVWRANENWWHYHLDGLKKHLGENPGSLRVLEAVRAGCAPSALLPPHTLPSARIEARITRETENLASRSAARSVGSDADKAMTAASR
jgi:hypothetical protein